MTSADRLFAPVDIEAGFTPRRSERVGLEGALTDLFRPDQSTVPATVHNVSPCGFMVECESPAGIGSYVSLHVPGVGRVEAQIRWHMGNRMGGMFLDPISLSECAWTAAS